MPKLRIGIDYGDTLADSVSLKSAIASSGFKITVDPIYFHREYVLRETVLSAEQYEMILALVYNTKTFGTDRMNPVAGALDVVRKLQEDGHDLSIITSHWEKSIPLAEEWLKQKGLDIPIIGVGKGRPKQEACAQLDVYIDDELRKLETLTTHELIWLCRFPLQTMEAPDGITVATSWYQIYQYIQRIPEAE